MYMKNWNLLLRVLHVPTVELIIAFAMVKIKKEIKDVVQKLLSYTKKEAYQWFLYLDSLFRGDTLKQSSLIVDICEVSVRLYWMKNM